MAEETKKEEIQMEYRMLGNTGLKVSTLSFGFWATYGVKEGVDRCVAVLKICRAAGINFFDNAEAYGKENGDAEIIMGQALKKLREADPKLWRRTDIVISTKIFWGPGGGQNEKGLSRKHVLEGTNASLKRLQLDYVDVVFCHRPDPLTPTEEVVRGFTQLIREGKAYYWGTSEWTAQQITEAYWIAKMENLIPPVVEQPQYNLFERTNMEKNYLRLFEAPYKIGTTIWSPLASGVLTGKYNEKIPEGSRMAQKGYEWLKKRWEAQQAEKTKIIQKLQQIAEKDLNTSITCLAIAWCIKNKNVSCVLLGATKEHQIEENLKSLAVAKKITPEIMQKIERACAGEEDDVINDLKKESAKTNKYKPTLPGTYGRVLVNKTDPL